jgi:hypothetical protein
MGVQTCWVRVFFPNGTAGSGAFVCAHVEGVTYTLNIQVANNPQGAIGAEWPSSEFEDMFAFTSRAFQTMLDDAIGGNSWMLIVLQELDGSNYKINIVNTKRVLAIISI